MRKPWGRWQLVALAGIASYSMLAGVAPTVLDDAHLPSALEPSALQVATSLAAAVVYAVVLLGALLVLALRVRTIPAARSAWVLMASGASVLALCQLVLLGLSAAAPNSAGASAELAIATIGKHPALAAAGLVAYPLLYAGQMRLLQQHVSGVLPSAWLDGLLAGLLLVAGACAYAAPLLNDHFGLGLTGALALVLRPLFDLLLVLFAAANWALVGRGADRRLVMLTTAFALLTLADTAGVARVTGVLAGALAPVLPAAVHPAGLDTAASVFANTARLLVLLVLVAAATPSAVRRSAQMVRWSSIASPAVVMVAALGLLWHDHASPLSTAAVATALLALVGVGVKGLLLFKEVLALADSRRLALSDDLTGLANRRALNLALAAAVPSVVSDAETGAAGRTGVTPAAQVALLLVDLNGFKAINDRYGHTTGDALLRWAAARLAAVVPPGTLLARLGGDEFAMLITGEAAGDAYSIAQAGATAISTPTSTTASRATDTPQANKASGPSDDAGTVVGDQSRAGEPVWPDQLPYSAALTASIGLAALGPGTTSDATTPSAVTGHLLSPPDACGLLGTPGVSGEELLRRADVAMYRAKAAGDPVRRYNLQDDRADQDRSRLLEELRTALTVDVAADDDAQIVVHYQPQVDLGTGRMCGVEALVRWRHPRLGLLSPAAFVDLAEEHGLIGAMTDRVLRTATADAARWYAGGHLLRVAVNLSTSCLVNPSLLSLIDDVLAQTGLDPRLLVMEVTETTLMSDPEQALTTARGIRQRGVQLSIDDYGTGYSSLAYLGVLPATELKLDRSFTARLTQDSATAAIVASTVELAHRLGLRLLAEGVEDGETLAALAAAGCDESQGYLHARPAPAAEVVRWLTGERLAAATVSR